MWSDFCTKISLCSLYQEKINAILVLMVQSDEWDVILMGAQEKHEVYHVWNNVGVFVVR